MKTTGFILLTAVLTMLWGCSSDDDNGNASSGGSTFFASETPAWSVDLTGSDATPSWTAPDPTKYESSMFIIVKLQEDLLPYSTDDDRMTVFIGNECRAVPAVPNKDKEGNISFVLKIRGNSTDRSVNLTLCYYCAQLHQTFVIEGEETFVSELTYGSDEDFVPPLLKGCRKYPVQQQLTVNLPVKEPFPLADNDIIAAFAGSECRGVGRVGQPFTVFCTATGETLQLRYYSHIRAGIYSFRQNVTVSKDQSQTVTLSF